VISLNLERMRNEGGTPPPEFLLVAGDWRDDWSQGCRKELWGCPRHGESRVGWLSPSEVFEQHGSSPRVSVTSDVNYELARTEYELLVLSGLGRADEARLLKGTVAVFYRGLVQYSVRIAGAASTAAAGWAAADAVGPSGARSCGDARTGLA